MVSENSLGDVAFRQISFRLSNVCRLFSGPAAENLPNSWLFSHLLLFDPHLFSAIVFHAGLCSVNDSNSWMVGFGKKNEEKKMSANNSVFHCEEFKECHGKSAHLNRLIEKKRCYFLNQSLCIKTLPMQFCALFPEINPPGIISSDVSLISVLQTYKFYVHDDMTEERRPR